MAYTRWDEYQTRPIGRGNPYSCCIGCGTPEPHINGDINAHGKNCSEVKRYFAEQNAELTFSPEDDWVHVSYGSWGGKDLLENLGYLTGTSVYLQMEDARALSEIAEETNIPTYWKLPYYY